MIIITRLEYRLDSFTFHSGYILILSTVLLSNKVISFTFHSGYILINTIANKAVSLKHFTFHSGYILIELNYIAEQGEYPLHSILVIF